MKTAHTLLMLALCPHTVACQSDDGGASADASIRPAADASPIIDAGPQASDAQEPQPDAAPAIACPPVLDIVDFQPESLQVGFEDPTSRFIVYPLPAPDTGELSDLVVYVAPEVPGGEFALGTFPITPALGTPDCFRCFLVQTAYTSQSAFYYVAQEGSFSVDSVSGRFTGRFDPPAGQDTATLTGFTVFSDGSFTAHEECAVEAEALSWDIPVPF